MRDKAGSEMMAKAKRQINYELKQHSKQITADNKTKKRS
jgi:hypothetical protein